MKKKRLTTDSTKKPVAKKKPKTKTAAAPQPPQPPAFTAPTHDMHGDPICEKVRALIELNHTLPEQRSPGWYEQRKTRMTASPVASILRLTQFEIDLRDNGDVDMEFDRKPGHVMPAFDTYNALMRKKCGVGEVFKGNATTEWGVTYEPVITALYEVINGTQVHEFGMIPHPTLDWLGASPDGITSQGRMLEIKCPPRRIPKTNSRGEAMPKIQYWVQMQIQMECCGFDTCDFVDVQIEEYGSRWEYLSDRYGSVEDGTFVYNRTHSGQAKGLVIQKTTYDHEGEEHFEYFYPPVLAFASQAEEDAWIEGWIHSQMDVSTDCLVSMLHELTRYKVRYWRVENFLTKTIEKNEDWLAERLPEIHEFWKKVLQYREEGIPEDLSRPPSDFGMRSSSSSVSTNQLFIDPSNLRLVESFNQEECQFLDEDDADLPSVPLHRPLRAATAPVFSSTSRTKSKASADSQECLFYDSDDDE